MIQELDGHHGANRVAAGIFGAGTAASIAVPPGIRIEAAGLKNATQDVSFDSLFRLGVIPGIVGPHVTHPSSLPERAMSR